VGDIFMKQAYTLYRQVNDRKKAAIGIPYLERIKDLSLIYPEKDGIWGTIVAVPDSYIPFKKAI